MSNPFLRVGKYEWRILLCVGPEPPVIPNRPTQPDNPRPPIYSYLFFFTHNPIFPLKANSYHSYHSLHFFLLLSFITSYHLLLIKTDKPYEYFSEHKKQYLPGQVKKKKKPHKWK
jgi:hypothetical protein